MNTRLVLISMLTGCFSATVHLAEVPSARSPTVDDSFHLNLFDLIEVSDAVDLHAACGGQRPVSIGEGLTPLGAVVNVIVSNYLPIFSLMNTSVNCAR